MCDWISAEVEIVDRKAHWELVWIIPLIVTIYKTIVSIIDLSGFFLNTWWGWLGVGCIKCWVFPVFFSFFFQWFIPCLCMWKWNSAALQNWIRTVLKGGGSLVFSLYLNAGEKTPSPSWSHRSIQSVIATWIILFLEQNLQSWL